ncbi:MAG: ACT domain-containing protein [Christensenellales bacterium]
MEIKMLGDEFTVCKTDDITTIDFADEFVFVAKTDEEISVVRRSGAVPDSVIAREEGWNGFRIQGSLDFSLTGILAGISSVLAEKGIPLFAVSTFNTDYFFVQKEYIEKATAALYERGYTMAD